MTTKVTRDVFDGSVRPITTIDINGGTIDGAVIGGSTPAAGTFTTVTAATVQFGVGGVLDVTNASIVGVVHAHYADVAEYYRSDEEYPPGTIVQIGGKAEITLAVDDVFGVVSSQPAWVLNSEIAQDPTVIALPIALIGRVPCRIVGPVKKGQRIIVLPGGIGTARIIGEETHVGSMMIGISVVDDDRYEERLVEISTTVRTATM